MIQNISAINYQIQKIQSILSQYAGSSHSSCHIQSVYGTAKSFGFSIRIPGETFWVYFGRGSGSEGIWILEDKPPKEIRLSDNFLRFIKKHLIGGRLISIQLPFNDRLINLSYYKNGGFNQFYLFYRGRDLYFAHCEQILESKKVSVLISWRGKTEIFENNSIGIDFILNEFRELGVADYLIEQTSIEQSRLFDEELDWLKNQKNNVKEVKAKKRKLENIQNDLKKCQLWRELETVVNSVNFENMPDYKYKQLKIKLNKQYSHFKNLDLVYKKIKALKKGEEILQQRFLEASEIEDKSTVSDYAKLVKTTKPIWKNTENKKASQSILDENKNSHIKEFIINQKRAAIGLNSLGNDYLRSRWASKADLWFHLENYKSSHLIIKVSNLSELNEVDLKVIGSILRDYSRLEIDKIPLVLTNVKNLRGTKGTAGLVRYKNEKYLQVDYLPKWEELAPILK
jgi:predicted ribosome quality control (RQC) complex YloA/Tae2 family protein